MVALDIFWALTKLKSAANVLPYTSQVTLGLFGQCNAQASKVAHWIWSIKEIIKNKLKNYVIKNLFLAVV